MKIAFQRSMAALLAFFRFTGHVRESDRLLWCVSSMYWHRGSVRCEGWCFHRDRPLTGVSLGWMSQGRWHFVGCRYGGPRAVVGAQHPGTPHAVPSGFAVNGRLPAPRVSGMCLRAFFGDGTYQQVHLGHWGRIRLEIAVRTGWYTVRRARRFGWNRLLYSALFGRAVGRFAVAFRARGALLIVDHTLGGGANYYRDSLLRARRLAAQPTVLLCYDHDSLSYEVQVLHGAEAQACVLASTDALSGRLLHCPVGEILVNDLVSFPDPPEAARWVLALRQTWGARLTVAVHEYFWICPSFHLRDYRGAYCGVPDRSVCRRCLGQNRYAGVDFPDIDAWRAVWGGLFAQAASVLCFSRSSAALLGRAFPGLDMTKVAVVPHAVEYVSPRPLRPDLRGALHIGVVGEISEVKGAGIVSEMARLIEARALPARITVVGTMSVPSSSASHVLRVTGRYARRRLPDVIQASGANLFFVPSIWPETFSYVTEELIRLGVPLAVFDLGAQAERVRAYPHGTVIPTISAEAALAHLLGFHARLRAAAACAG